jgi:hypothetical protein
VRACPTDSLAADHRAVVLAEMYVCNVCYCQEILRSCRAFPSAQARILDHFCPLPADLRTAKDGRPAAPSQAAAGRGSPQSQEQRSSAGTASSASLDPTPEPPPHRATAPHLGGGGEVGEAGDGSDAAGGDKVIRLHSSYGAVAGFIRTTLRECASQVVCQLSACQLSACQLRAGRYSSVGVGGMAWFVAGYLIPVELWGGEVRGLWRSF